MELISSSDNASAGDLLTFLSTSPSNPFRQYPFGSSEVATHAWRDQIIDYSRKNGNEIRFAVEHGAITGVMGFRRSSWDSIHFGFPVASLDHLICKSESASSALLDSFDRWAQSNIIRFSSARMDENESMAQATLENHGFNKIETSIWGLRPIEREQHFAPKQKIRPARPEEIPMLMELAARENYRDGRFHADGHFDRDTANRLYSEWIASAAHAGHAIYVAELEQKIVGVVVYRDDIDTARYLGNPVARFSFLAVAEACRKQHIGLDLILGALQSMVNRYDWVETGVSEKNIPSRQLMARVGFRWVSSTVVFHRWSE